MTSWIWSHFKTIMEDSRKAESQICHNIISRGKDASRLTLSSLRRHLNNVHSIKNPKEAEEGSSSKCASDSRQPTIVETLAKKQKLDLASPRAIKITRCISEMIAADFMPYSTVENRGFRRILDLLEPRYNIPSRAYISQVGIPKLYEDTKAYIYKLSSNAIGGICSTTDIWSSRECDSFMSVTANFFAYNKHGVIKRYTPVLSCKEMTGSHNSENILLQMTQLEKDWAVKFDAVLSDNGANVVKALADGQYLNIRCMAHTINLCVTHSLACQDTVKDVITATRSIVGHYHRSYRDARLLSECQRRMDFPEHKLIQDVCTRWNSTYYMLERFLEQREVINDMSYRGISNTLTSSQWRLAACVVKVLKIFVTATNELSCDSATASLILPTIMNLINRVDEFTVDPEITHLEELLEDLKSQLQRRFVRPVEGVRQNRDAYFKNRKTWEYCAVSSALDPRIKHYWCSKSESSEVEELCLSYVTSNINVSGAESSESNGESSSTSETEDSVAFPRDHGRQREDRRQKDRLSLVVSTLRQYLAEKHVSKKRCPAKFWEDRCSKDCPHLFKLALKFLSCPATSVESERLFSSAGNIVSPLRNRLTPKNVEVLTFLHVNLHKLDFLN